MTLRALRIQHAKAFSAWQATSSHKWAAEVARLNKEIMKRCRPARRKVRDAGAKQGFGVIAEGAQS